MFKGSHKCLVTGKTFIPPTVLAREKSGHEDFIYRCVEAHPGKAPGERSGILGEQFGPIRILKIANPVRHAEMTEINDRCNVQFPDAAKSFVRELPIVLSGAQMRRHQWWTITQVVDSGFLGKKSGRGFYKYAKNSTN